MTTPDPATARLIAEIRRATCVRCAIGVPAVPSRDGRFLVHQAPRSPEEVIGIAGSTTCHAPPGEVTAALVRLVEREVARAVAAWVRE